MNTDKARAVLPWVGVEERDGNGRPVVLVVPASPAWPEKRKRGAPRFARVTVRRDAASLHFDCQGHALGDPAGEPCIAVTKGHICYHCLSAALACTAETGGILYFYSSADKASAGASNPPARYARGRVLTLRAGDGTAWAVYYPPAERTEQRTGRDSGPVHLQPLPIGRE